MSTSIFAGRAGRSTASEGSTGLRFLPESSAIILLVGVLPVKFIFWTWGDSMRALVIAAASALLCAMTFKTPSGRPASRKQSPIAQEQRGRTRVLSK